MFVCLLWILSNKLDLNQETRLTIQRFLFFGEGSEKILKHSAKYLGHSYRSCYKKNNESLTCDTVAVWKIALRGFWPLRKLNINSLNVSSPFSFYQLYLNVSLGCFKLSSQWHRPPSVNHRQPSRKSWQK